MNCCTDMLMCALRRQRKKRDIDRERERERETLHRFIYLVHL